MLSQKLPERLSVLALVAIVLTVIAIGVVWVYNNRLSGQFVSTDCCTESQKAAGYRCVGDCGPPVIGPEDKDRKPTYSCLSPEVAARRREYGCPICLASTTHIETPRGDILVSKLAPGMYVWTLDGNGRRIAAPIRRLSRRATAISQNMVKLVLSDGRTLFVSEYHPTARRVDTVGALMVSDVYDGANVMSIDQVPYDGHHTYDILPAGETGYYWANGILLASTLRPTP